MFASIDRFDKVILVQLLVIILSISAIKADSYCTSSKAFVNIAPTSLPDDFKCTNTSMNNNAPNKLFNSGIFGDQNYCEVYFLFDLSSEYMNAAQFSSLQYFLNAAVDSCFDNNIGRDFLFMNLNQAAPTDGDPIDECCDRERCSDHIFEANATDIVSTYYENPSVINYTANVVAQLKKITGNNNSCAYNTVTLITDRLVDWTVYNKEFAEIFEHNCIYFSVIVVGNANVTTEQVKKIYGSTTKFYYLVHDFNCLMQIASCMTPCNKPTQTDCKNEVLDTCSPLTTPPASTTTIPSTTTERYPGAEHVLYTFALSENTTQEQFQIVLSSIKKAIQDSTKPNLTFAIVLRSDLISPWFTSLEVYQSYFVHLNITETMLEDVDSYDQSDEHTTERLTATMYHKNITGRQVPDIFLITDFIALEFIKEYESLDSKFSSTLSHYGFKIVCTVNQSFEYFQNNTNLSKDVLYFSYMHPWMMPIGGPNITNYNNNNGDKISEKTVLIIIFGAIGGALSLLCAGSFIYRQRMSWRTKLESIRVNHKKHNVDQSEETDIHLDYWELTWDRLLVKSDKLGSGAYGQVLRGKIIGQPPCVESYYQTLQIRNFTHMENCDVAIKMLPKYADEAAKKEFTNEIELMKMIGYHDNIVNLLGCVTVGHPICLVLEFCPFRDLHQYVKARKVEVSISNSMEEKINHTKDFLIFAWQIAHGMKFLVSKGVIHRDLAARNILIDGDRNAKISDFGLCIQTNENTSALRKASVSASGRLPIKWLAIESLKSHEFSYKSDVWSFGIVLFEMYSFGEIPFSKVEPKDLMEHLDAGNRPEKPELCNQETYDIMVKCWREKPESRPPFEELLTVFTVFLERTTEGYGYLPLLKSETTQNTNDVSQKLAANMSPEGAENNNKKRRKSLYSADSFSLFGILGRRVSSLSNNKSEPNTPVPPDDATPGPSKEKSPWFKKYYDEEPDAELGRTQSFISDSVTSNFSLDPGVEIVNGRPRLRNQSSDVGKSVNSSMRKSLSFHHGVNQMPTKREQRRPSMGFTEKILKKFRKDTPTNKD